MDDVTNQLMENGTSYADVDSPDAMRFLTFLKNRSDKELEGKDANGDVMLTANEFYNQF